MPRIVIRAHAKLNLALALGPPEPEESPRAGWHPICTWMHAIDLADEVLIEPLGLEGDPGLGSGGDSGGDSDWVSTWSAAWSPEAPRQGLVDWPPEKDLAWRALRAIEAHVGRRLPTRVALQKRIPAGGGLGGGSSDAGAALVGIDLAWGLGLGEERLVALAATLGSDVPFFVDGGWVDGAGVDGGRPPRPAIVSGFGETIERTARVSGEVVLVIPGFGCPTGGVYRAFDASLVRGPRAMQSGEVRALADAASPGAGELFNDLEAPAFAVRPELREICARASAVLGREVHLTGSGSTAFALVGAGESGPAAAQVRAALPGVAVLSSRLV